MKYIITGSSGFIGSHLSDYLKLKGHVVHPYSRTEPCRVHKTKYYSVTSYQHIERAINSLKPDCVIHLAALGNNPKHKDDNEIMKTNVLGTYYTVKAAVHNKIPRYIYVSTSSVYPKGKTYFKEYEPLPPSHESMYAQTKAIGEQIVQYYGDRISTAIMRPFTIYGEYESPNRLTQVAAEAIINQKPFTLVTKAVHDWTYVLDFCYALEFMSRNVNEGIYNFGTGTQHTNLEVVRILEKHLGKKAIFKPIDEMDHFRKFDTKNWKADTEKMKSVGLKTVTSLEEGLKYICQSKTK